jgi:hypothetical protein
MSRKVILRGTRGPSLAMCAALGATLVFAGVAALVAPSASAADYGARTHLASSARFHVTGIVSAVKADSVNLFVESGTVAGRSASHEQVTVHFGRAHIRELTARNGHLRHRERTFVVGEVARFSGSVLTEGSSNGLWAQSGTVTPTPVIALVGTVYETGGSLVIVDRSIFGRGDQMNAFVQPVVVDDSDATVTLDGNSADTSQITAGQTVIVLGTNEDETILAASIYAFSTPPTIATGILQTVSGTTLAISQFGGHFDPWSQGDSWSTGPFLVDSPATIVLNGVSGAPVSDLAPGDAIIAVGPSGTTPLAATTVFASNQLDTAPTFFFRHHGHFHGGPRGKGWSGQQAGGGDSGGGGQGSGA